ncbi:MAG: histidinol-phosphatase HisJ family protein [Bacillota bacterium]|nr:histidinol-phosphatase HisJ family protein [Bacillota bacterium]
MPERFLADCHVHSNCSFDGKNTVSELCKEAVKKQLNAVTITDHLEVPLLDKPNGEMGDFRSLIPLSVKKINQAKEQYKGILDVFCGVEIGEPCHDIKKAQEALAFSDFDYVLASVHNLRGKSDFFWLEYSADNVNDYLNLYFDEILETVNWGKFNSLAHLTYPLRYIVLKTEINVDLSLFSKKIDEIFKIMIEKELALEINTSGLRQKIGKTLPDTEIIQRFRELGGKYITLGSDAHNCKDLAFGLIQGLKEAQTAGFTEYTVFKQRKPNLFSINEAMI